jgi:phosphoribosylaminoimidazole-succinocarboxamide synthase
VKSQTEKHSAKDKFSKNTLLYEGSVKRIFSSGVGTDSLVFEFTDDYSVFDWGKMPDTIPAKGEVLARLAALFFEKLQSPQEWQHFFASADGHRLQEDLFLKSSSKDRAGYLISILQVHGLRTHYKEFDGGRDLLVKKIAVHRPSKNSALGVNYYSYPEALEAPFLIPLEVVFRFEVSAGSSFIKRNYDRAYKVGDKFETPFVETFTKLEPQDRALATSEAFAISGLNTQQFEDLYFKTSLVAGILKFWFAEVGLHLVDGKLEWGISADGEVMLVDAMGPDEMRLERQGWQLSKEVLRDFYRQTPWYKEVEAAKANAELQGVQDWKTLVSEPPLLPPRFKVLISEMYQALFNELRREKIFACPDLDAVIVEMKTVLNKGTA